MSSNSGFSLGLTVVTGDPCPEAGYWRALGREGEDVLVFKDDLMPTCERQVVRWMFVRRVDLDRKAARSRR
ncbi:MAG: hypothetical protein WBG08_06345 [Litorimonas sp.]